MQTAQGGAIISGIVIFYLISTTMIGDVVGKVLERY